LRRSTALSHLPPLPTTPGAWLIAPLVSSPSSFSRLYLLGASFHSIGPRTHETNRPLLRLRAVLPQRKREDSVPAVESRRTVGASAEVETEEPRLCGPAESEERSGCKFCLYSEYTNESIAMRGGISGSLLKLTLLSHRLTDRNYAFCVVRRQWSKKYGGIEVIGMTVRKSPEVSRRPRSWIPESGRIRGRKPLFEKLFQLVRRLLASDPVKRSRWPTKTCSYLWNNNSITLIGTLLMLYYQAVGSKSWFTSAQRE